MRARESAKYLKPEIELLVCCARQHLNAAHAARLNEILQGSVDWEFLFRAATQHGLLPLLSEHLPVSSATPSQFREANRNHNVRTLFLTAEALRIADRFASQNLPVLTFKGPVLAQMAYGNPSLRQFDDLDFIVPQRFIADVYEQMDVLGYRPKFQLPRRSGEAKVHIPGEYVFVHKVNQAMVEIHTEATLRHFPRPPDIEDMSRRSTQIVLNGKAVTTFGLADTLLMLCVHGAKDFWSRLLWVADVAEVIDRIDAAEWECILVQAKKYDTERMLRLGLWVARVICGSELPVRVSQDVEADSTAARIGGVVRDELLHQEEHPRGVVWRSHYRIRMVQPIWKGILYWLRLSTAPTEEDWVVAPDGTAGAIQHTFLRPLRLWRKYGRSIEPEK